MTTFSSLLISWNFFVIFFFKYHFLMWMKWLWYPNSYNTRFFTCFLTCFIFKFCQISTIFATTFWLVDNPNVHIFKFDILNDSNAFIYWLKTYFYQKYIKNECIFVYICVFCESVYGCIFYVFLVLLAV